MAIYRTLSTKVDANGFAQIMLLFRNGRKKRIRTKSGIFIPVTYWNDKKQDIVIPRKIGIVEKVELQRLQEELDIVEKRTLRLIDMYDDIVDKQFIEHVISLLSGYDGTITKEIVDGVIQQEQTEIEERKARENSISKNLFKYCDSFLSKGYSDARIRLYKVVFRSMARYVIFREKIENRPFEWNIDSVTKYDIEELFDYFKNEYKYRQKYRKVFDKEKIIYQEENRNKHKKLTYEMRGENRLVDMRKCVKTFWNWMLKSELTANNPFTGITIGAQKFGTPYYLTIDERNTIAEHDFSNNKSLETQRDIFIFQCLIGCRVGDLTQLTKDNVDDGILIYTPHKTKDSTDSFVARIPLNARALELIAKYDGIDSRGRLFPFISDQNYNDAIKTIMKECDINRMVNVRNSKNGEIEMLPINEIASSHMARRTFVGNAYRVVKDPNLIGRMSGHVEGSKAFARYRDIDDDMLKEVINAIK